MVSLTARQPTITVRSDEWDRLKNLEGSAIELVRSINLLRDKPSPKHTQRFIRALEQTMRFLPISSEAQPR